MFDGEPVLAPVGNTSLSVAVNTNWDVFVEPSTNTWYWLNNGAWLSAPDFKGTWSPVTKLPAAFSSLPSDANFAAVKKQIPGRTISARDMPMVFVSTLPAEVIVTEGTPRLVIPGTSLSYVSNTDANLFVENGTYYYLVAGRWYSAKSLDGPWTYATPSLPADFARIPPSSARGYVLVSVPGTPQAQEALTQSTIPTQATLDRNTTKVEIVYSGEPKFEPIPSTEMTHAVNTMYDVIKVGDKYYACYQAAWFVAPSPRGPWILASSVPTVIYTIPPSSPLYRVTFVKVYGETPTTVTYGYTTGYTMSYVSAGVVVYGTGYYYPPVIWPAPIPIYYPYYLGHRRLQPTDLRPVGVAGVVLLCGAGVQGDGRHALVDGDAAGVEERRQVVADAHPELAGDRDAVRRGGAHRRSQDRPEEVALERDRRAATLAGHLGRRAAEVEVDVVDPALAHEAAHRFAEHDRVAAIELQAPRLLVGREGGHASRLVVAVHERSRHHHLVDVEQPGPEPPAQCPERRVRDARHRGEDHRSCELSGPMRSVGERS